MEQFFVLQDPLVNGVFVADGEERSNYFTNPGVSKLPSFDIFAAAVIPS